VLSKNLSSEGLFPSISTPQYPFASGLALTQNTSVFLVSLFGNTLAHFEYIIYGFLAPILAIHFFPNEDSTISLIKAFSVIAAGSFARPLGALVFGYLGDIQGRSITLKYTMIGIAIPTFIIGVLPSYEFWGVKAVIALIICRMLQGIFIAAESDGVRIYVFEHFGHKHPCLISAFISCSAYVGMTFASLVASQVSLEGSSWRWAFLGSGICGFTIYFLRSHMPETPPFLRLQQKIEKETSLRNILKSRRANLIRTIMICGAVGGVYHFNFMFQCTYLSKVLNLISADIASQMSFYLFCLYVFTLPLAGWAADRWGYVKVGKIGGSITFSLAIVNIFLIMDGIVSFPMVVFITLSMAFYVAPAYLFLTQQYDVKIRFRCFCIGHAIGSMLFSGTNPVVCLYLWQVTGLSFAPFVYCLFLITLGMIAFIWRAKDHAYNAWFL